MTREEILGKKFPVLDQGFVILRDIMGTEEDIAEIARISYGVVKNPSKDASLIDRLMRDRHTSPFEMPVFRFQIKLPIVVERQWVRHRTCSMNEMSGRYREMPEEYYRATEFRAQSKTNKQGSEGELNIPVELLVDRDNTMDETWRQYHQLVELGVSLEQARFDLPLSTYTEKVWQMNLHNLLHFLKLRTDPHAQWEIRQYAAVIEQIVADVFPVTMASWKNHVKDAVTFSADEFELLIGTVDNNPILLTKIDESNLSETRKREFFRKLGYVKVS